MYTQEEDNSNIFAIRNVLVILVFYYCSVSLTSSLTELFLLDSPDCILSASLATSSNGPSLSNDVELSLMWASLNFFSTFTSLVGLVAFIKRFKRNVHIARLQWKDHQMTHFLYDKKNQLFKPGIIEIWIISVGLAVQ